jgi:hypothetical protein
MITTNKEVLISGVRKQKDMLEGLIDDLEPKESLEDNDLVYCEEVFKRVEGILRQLKKTKFDQGWYGSLPIYRIWSKL